MKRLYTVVISATLLYALPTAFGQGTTPAASDGFVAARLLSAPLPSYPPEAKAAGIGGVVVLRGTIGTNMRLSGLSYVSGPTELQQPALTAASSWVFAPYKLNGSPIEEQVTLSMSFDPATGKVAALDPAPVDANVPPPTRGGVRAFP